jgi:TRAP-type C4-dicarboxylate transport system permease small subunit
MLTRINDVIERVVGWLLAVLFTALILTVFAQVTARSVLEIPVIWTLDVAQLLFSWCIFIGAGLAFRHGQHYTVNLWPGGALEVIPRVAATIAACVVIYVLLVNGSAMTGIGLRRTSPALGITEAWFFLPIPLGAGLMALFLLERILDRKGA